MPLKSPQPVEADPPITGMSKLVVIEDDPTDRLLLRELLDSGAALGLQMQEADSAAAGKALVDADTACVLIDNMLPDGYGLELVSELRAAWPLLAIIMITGTGDEEIAAEALRRGANDYLAKKRMSSSRLQIAIQQALESNQLAAVMQRKQAQIALLSELVDSADDLLFVVDVRREAIVMGNAATRRALGRSDEDLGQCPAPVAHLFKAGDAAWHSLRGLLERMSPVRFQTTAWVGQYVGRPIEISARLATQNGRQFVIGIGRDVSELRSLQADLLQQTALDSQTGLPNQSAFLLQFEALSRVDEGEVQLWLLAAIHMKELTAVSRDIGPEALAEWRQQLAQSLRAASEPSGGCVGVFSPRTFLMALPVEDLASSRQVLERLQTTIHQQMRRVLAGLPARAVKHSASGKPAFGALLGPPALLTDADAVGRVVELAGEAELSGRLRVRRA